MVAKSTSRSKSKAKPAPKQTAAASKKVTTRVAKRATATGTKPRAKASEAKTKATSETKTKTKAKATKAKTKTKATSATKTKAKATPATKAKASSARAKPAKAAKPAKPALVPVVEVPMSVPTAAAVGVGKRRAAGEVVRILDADDPTAELRAFLANVPAEASPQQGEIVLGAAQLALLHLASEDRGGDAVRELLDLVLERWLSFPERTGFHAQEFLRNAFAAVGDDRERINKLAALVPIDASPELRFNVAAALSMAGDRLAMLRAVEAALACGATPAQFRRDDDFAAYFDDAQFQAILGRATAPAIPVDIEPHVDLVRESLKHAVKTLEKLGAKPELGPPASLDDVLAAETARNIQLPNDYRALLTLHDGMKLWDRAFFGTTDYTDETELAQQAREYLASNHGTTGLEECVPLANWGQPTDWLLYDPRGTIRGGEPGYVLMLETVERALDGLAHAIDRVERVARDALETN